MTDEANQNHAPEDAEVPGVEAPEFAADTEAFLRLAAENEELKDRSLRIA
jgi:hypothetical protein